LLAVTANTIGGRQSQGFVVRVDPKAKREPEQVQFYRCHPNPELQQVSARTFPDFESMKVNFKLMADKTDDLAPAALNAVPEIKRKPLLTRGAIIPGVGLVLLAILDWAMRTFSGAAIFDITHSILFVGGAVLLSLPALLRYVSEVFRH